jgi:hypothetical protein
MMLSSHMKKPKLAKSKLDGPIEQLVGRTEHKELVSWAVECAERVLHYYEESFPGDDRPRKAIEAATAWVRTGEFKMAEVRAASLSSHAAAREAAEYTAAHSAARAAGQAVAAAHVPRHALAAAIYAATAVRDSVEGTEAEAALEAEREWQYYRLLQLQH